MGFPDELFALPVSSSASAKKRNEETNAKVSPHLICPVCHEVFRDASMLRCGHTYCKDCIVRSLEPRRSYDEAAFVPSTGKCPICRLPATISSLSPNLTTQQIIMDLQVHCVQEDGTHPFGRKVFCGWKGSLGDWIKVHRAKNCPYEMITCDLEGCRVGHGESRRKPFKYIRCKRDAHLKTRHLHYYISQQNEKHCSATPHMLQIGNGTPASVVNGTYFLDGFNHKGTAIYKKQTLWNGIATHVVIGKYLHQRNKSATQTNYAGTSTSSTSNVNQQPRAAPCNTGNGIHPGNRASHEANSTDLGPLEPTAFETATMMCRNTNGPPIQNQYGPPRPTNATCSSRNVAPQVQRVSARQHPQAHRYHHPNNMGGMQSTQDNYQNARQDQSNPSWTQRQQQQQQYQGTSNGPGTAMYARGSGSQPAAFANGGDMAQMQSTSNNTFAAGNMPSGPRRQGQFSSTIPNETAPYNPVDSITAGQEANARQPPPFPNCASQGSRFPPSGFARGNPQSQHAQNSATVNAAKPPLQSTAVARPLSTSTEEKKQEEHKDEDSKIAPSPRAGTNNETKPEKRYWYISIVPLGCERGDVHDIDLYRCRADESSRFPPRHGWRDLRSPRIGSNRYPVYESRDPLVVNVVGRERDDSTSGQKRSADSSTLDQNKRARPSDRNPPHMQNSRPLAAVAGRASERSRSHSSSSASDLDDIGESDSSSLYDSEEDSDDDDDDSEGYSSTSQSFEHDHFDIFDSLSSSSSDYH